LAAGGAASVEILTTTPTSRPASWANTSANGVCGRSARLGAAGGGAGFAAAGFWAGLGVAGGWAGLGAAAGRAGVGAAAAAGGWARLGAAIVASNANKAATIATRGRKALTPLLPWRRQRNRAVSLRSARI
jgi:hypothetical protein